MPRRPKSPGSTMNALLYTRRRVPNLSTEFVDEIFRQNVRTRVDEFIDFTGPTPSFSLDVPLFATATSTDTNMLVVTTGASGRALVRVQRAGVLSAAYFVGEDALAASDTNYLTFTVTNRLASGSGSTAMLAATDANTTKATGGSAIVAKAEKTLTVHGTAANLVVNKGDELEIAATVTGTLANLVDSPRVQLVFETIDREVTPRVLRTAGAPAVQRVANAANGEATFTLTADSEAQYVGFDFGDQLCIQANKAPIVQIRGRLTALPGANQRFVAGLASAFNATIDSITSLAIFRCEASGALLVESDDGTTDTDDQATSPATTLVATTNYCFTIDLTDLNRILFYLDDAIVGTTSAALLGSAMLQVLALFQKDSGIGTGGFIVDYVRYQHDRF